MSQLSAGFRTQGRVIGALILRELNTRFGRENIGFLWMMAEPLLFAMLVGLLWRAVKGPFEFGFDIIAFTVSGYIPMVLFRTTVSRAVSSLTANGGLLYHRQIKLMDFVISRFLVEFLGHLMAYFFIALVLIALGFFPVPFDVLYLLLGWAYYSLFTFSIALIVAPLSEISEAIEKFIPVTTYIMVPFSGAFYFVSSLSPEVAKAVLYSPPVHGMEMMRLGIFGPQTNAQFDFVYPVAFCFPCIAVGLILCKHVRRTMVVE